MKNPKKEVAVSQRASKKTNTQAINFKKKISKKNRDTKIPSEVMDQEADLERNISGTYPESIQIMNPKKEDSIKPLNIDDTNTIILEGMPIEERTQVVTLKKDLSKETFIKTPVEATQIINLKDNGLLKEDSSLKIPSIDEKTQIISTKDMTRGDELKNDKKQKNMGVPAKERSQIKDIEKGVFENIFENPKTPIEHTQIINLQDSKLLKKENLIGSTIKEDTTQIIFTEDITRKNNSKNDKKIKDTKNPIKEETQTIDLEKDVFENILKNPTEHTQIINLKKNELLKKENLIDSTLKEDTTQIVFTKSTTKKDNLKNDKKTKTRTVDLKKDVFENILNTPNIPAEHTQIISLKDIELQKKENLIDSTLKEDITQFIFTKNTTRKDNLKNNKKPKDTRVPVKENTQTIDLKKNVFENVLKAPTEHTQIINLKDSELLKKENLADSTLKEDVTQIVFTQNTTKKGNLKNNKKPKDTRVPVKENTQTIDLKKNVFENTLKTPTEHTQIINLKDSELLKKENLADSTLKEDVTQIVFTQNTTKKDNPKNNKKLKSMKTPIKGKTQTIDLKKDVFENILKTPTKHTQIINLKDNKLLKKEDLIDPKLKEDTTQIVFTQNITKKNNSKNNKKSKGIKTLKIPVKNTNLKGSDLIKKESFRKAPFIENKTQTTSEKNSFKENIFKYENKDRGLKSLKKETYQTPERGQTENTHLTFTIGEATQITNILKETFIEETQTLSQEEKIGFSQEDISKKDLTQTKTTRENIPQERNLRKEISKKEAPNKEILFKDLLEKLKEKNKSNSFGQEIYFLILSRQLQINIPQLYYEDKSKHSLQIKRLKELIHLYENQNHYERLHLDYSTSVEDVQNSFSRFYQLLQYPDAKGELYILSKKALRYLEEARNVLGNMDLRASYTAKLIGTSKNTVTKQSDTDLAYKALLDGNYRTALKIFDRIPKTPDYESKWGLYHLWAIMKCRRRKPDKIFIQNVKKRLFSLPIPYDPTHHAHYHITKGLYYKLLKDYISARDCFEHAKKIVTSIPDIEEDFLRIDTLAKKQEIEKKKLSKMVAFLFKKKAS